MLRTLSIACLCLVALLGVASADIIDDFTVETTSGVTLNTSPAIDVTQDTSLDPDHVIGGEREVRLLLESGDQTLWEITSDDNWRFNNNAATTATAALNYGKNPEWDLDEDGTFNEGADDGGPDPTTSGLDHNFRTDTAFRFEYFVDQQIDLDVQLTSHLDDVGGTEHTETQTITVPINNSISTPAVVYAPFSLWSASLDFTDVDSMTFQIRSDQALDLEIVEISSIPEPATISLLGLGALALARRRRRRKR
jgi:hypothetical protein